MKYKCMYMYVCMCVYICMYMYACMCVYICIYVYNPELWEKLQLHTFGHDWWDKWSYLGNDFVTLLFRLAVAERSVVLTISIHLHPHISVNNKQTTYILTYSGCESI